MSSPNPWRTGARELTDEDRRLLALFDDLRKGSLTFQDEAAKTLITLIGVLYGVFFAVFSFAEAPSVLRESVFVKLLAAGVLIAYLWAVFFALLVILPRRYRFSGHSLTQMRDRLEGMLEIKGRFLQLAYIAFFLGTLLFVVGACVVLLA